ncbi:MAG: secretin N-terminal domain-containing protein, partial [Candidatus Hydrogenedens sp.]
QTTQETPAEEGTQPPMPREATPEQAIDATAEITRELRELQTTNEEPDKQLVPITPEETKPAGKITEAEKPKEEILSEVKIKPSPKGLDTITDFECEQMPLAKVVPLLAYKAGINVIAGADLKGNVTMSLKQVTLRKAIEAALRMNGLGIIQEENIYRIVPYEEALSSDRSTIVVRLENAKATEIRKVLEEITKGTKGREYITLSANDTTNVVILSGPEENIQGLAQMAKELDIAKPIIPTITTTIKLNYADPDELAKSIQKILTPKTGNVSADARARNIIVTDIPVVVEQVKEIVKTLDIPVKQVLIDTMVVDATLGDESQTGIDWLLKSVRNQSWRDFVMYGPEGRKVGNIQQLDLGGASQTGDTIGNLTFNILTREIDWKGIIKAQIQNRNGHLISNPVVATIENKPATITISQEIPYIDLSQTSEGGALTNTRFKQIGTVLEVTPRVTHDNHVIIDIKGKESTVVGEFNGVPIEDMRQVTSTLHINSGQTIFVGGLRKRNDSVTSQKMPILGDIPVLNVVFKSNQRKAQINELLIFLTCSVLEQELPELTDEQKKAYDDAKQAPMDADL